MMSDLSDLSNAIFNRSLGTLTEQPLWPIRWVLIIGLRFIIYFNPVFIFFVFYYLLSNLCLKNFKKNILFSTVLIFFTFGLIHILLYPDGSFGHPYWIYYLTPFVVFSSSFISFSLFKRRRYTLFSIFIACFIFTFLIQSWKQEQIKSNIWRYDLAQKADVNLHPYEKILVNVNSAIDIQLLKYKFNHDVIIAGNKSEIDGGKYEHFLYACVSKCLTSDSFFTYLRNNYKSTLVSNTDGEAYVFELKAKQVVGNAKTKLLPAKAVQKNSPEGMLKRMYRILKVFLNAPQI